jgi:hypothetical protein
MIAEMANIAAECLKHPKKKSVWSPELGRYVCPDSEEGKRALDAGHRTAQANRTRTEGPEHSPIDPQFKLVFVTAAIGTLLFILICVAVTVWIGKDMPSPVEKLVSGLFDLAKIGFGAVVGLLGGKAIQGGQHRRRPSA